MRNKNPGLRSGSIPTAETCFMIDDTGFPQLPEARLPRPPAPPLPVPAGQRFDAETWYRAYVLSDMTAEGRPNEQKWITWATKYLEHEVKVAQPTRFNIVTLLVRLFRLEDLHFLSEDRKSRVILFNMATELNYKGGCGGGYVGDRPNLQAEAADLGMAVNGANMMSLAIDVL